MREFEINKIFLFHWNGAVCLLVQIPVSYRGAEVKLIGALGLFSSGWYVYYQDFFLNLI